MDSLRLKQKIKEAVFESPSDYLVSIQHKLAACDDHSLENNQEFVDKASTAFLACGLSLFWGPDCTNEIATSFDDEGSDVDWVVRSQICGDLRFVSVQVKTHLKEFWSAKSRNPQEYHQYLEEQIIALRSAYPDSKDVVFTIHINKAVDLNISKLTELAQDLDFSGLFLTGRGNAEGSEYVIVGDLLGRPEKVEHHYFSLSSCGRIMHRGA